MQDGDDNEYLTMGTKHVYTRYIKFWAIYKIIYMCVCDKENMHENKIKNFVMKITEICGSVSD
jgi:hypothetical protein